MSMVMVILDDNEVIVGNDQVLSIHLTQNLWYQNLLRRSCGKQFRFEQYETVYSGSNHVDVVCDHKDREFQIAVQLLDQFDDAMLSREVQTRRRLIQKQYSRLLRQGSCDEDPLLLPPR